MRGGYLQPTTATVPSRKRYSRTSKKKLSALSDVPLDVLLEIFDRLHPRDLVNISRASKTFRETLLAQCTSGTWKRALRVCGAPDCPADLKPLGWATLLFITNCQGCDTKNVQKIDFLLRRRLCRKCRTADLFQFSKFQRVYPKLDKETFNLVPYTTSAQVRPGMKSVEVEIEKSKRRYVYGPDVERIAHRISGYTPSALVRFREKQEATIRDRITNLSVYEAWVTFTKNLIVQQRIKDINKRLIEAGYTAGEVNRPCENDSSPRYKCYYQPTPLTDSIWRRIGPILTAELDEYRAQVTARWPELFWALENHSNSSSICRIC